MTGIHFCSAWLVRHYAVVHLHCFLLFIFTLPTGAVVKYCDEYVCLCMSVCPRGYLQNTRTIFTKFFVHVACVCGSVLLQHADNRPHRLSSGRGDGSAQHGRSVIWLPCPHCRDNAFVHVCHSYVSSSKITFMFNEFLWNFQKGVSRKGAGTISVSVIVTPILTAFSWWTWISWLSLGFLLALENLWQYVAQNFYRPEALPVCT